MAEMQLKREKGKHELNNLKVSSRPQHEWEYLIRPEAPEVREVGVCDDGPTNSYAHNPARVQLHLQSFILLIGEVFP